MECTLMNKTRPLIKLEGDFLENKKKVGEKEYVSPFPVFVVSSGVALEEDEHFYPVRVGKPNDRVLNDTDIKRLNRFFELRSIQANRVGLNKKMQLKEEITGTDNYHLFSLSDQYWLQFHSHQKWENLNFFTNPNLFESYNGKLFFSKNVPLLKEMKFSMNSPDMTLGGISRKRWECENGKYFLYKANENINMITHEIVASKIAEILLHKNVKGQVDKNNKIIVSPYSYIIDSFELCCKSPNLINSSQELVTLGDIITSFQYSTVNDNKDLNKFEIICKAVNRADIPGCHVDIVNGKMDISNLLSSPLILLMGVSIILGDFDRHVGNIVFIRNVDTGTYEDVIPFFDFGGSFISSKPKIGGSDNFFPDIPDSVKKRWYDLLSINSIEKEKMEDIVNIFSQIDTYLLSKEERVRMFNILKSNSSLINPK